MNFRTILIIIILNSLLFSKSIHRERNTNRVIIKKEFTSSRYEENIITIDFEGDVSDWTQDVTNGWELTSESYNSSLHSYNSPDINNSGNLSTHSLYSQPIDLPSVVDGEIIQYTFALNCNMPDFIQENNPNTPVDESAFLADYYIVSVRDMDESAWHLSSFNSINGNNWWCGNEEDGGYLDSWFQYLDTSEIEITSSSIFSADMKWAIEDFNDVSVAGTCADGWDQANVQISTDSGTTWDVIEGSNPYDFQCGYGSIANGFEDMPGWGDIQDWHNVSFNLDDYIGQTIKLRFAFYSDVAWSVSDDDDLTGLQVDNILVETNDGTILFQNTGDDQLNMSISGSAWVDQLYDYCEDDRPGYLTWDTYAPGDAFEGNILMNLTSFAGKTIQFKFQTLYDGNHYSAEVVDAQGEGLYIDDLKIFKKSTFNPIPPSGVTAYLNDNNIYISWNDLNVSGTGEFIYDNNIFTPEHFIVIDDSNQEGTTWAGTEIYTAGTSIVDSVYIYVFGAFDGELAGFNSFGSDYNIESEYNETLAVLLLNEDFELDPTAHSWVGIDVNDWTFYGSFIIAQTLSEHYPVGYDPTVTPSSHSKILLGSGWENWIDIVPTLDDPLILDGEWGIRAKMTYSSPEATYNIYRNDILIQSGIESPTLHQDTDIESGNTYTYNVSAIYPNGEESPLSDGFTITVEDCEIDEPGCNCSDCSSGNCIFDCSLNCVDFYDSNQELFYLSYINNNNCDDGEEEEFNLFCDEFLNDGLDCIVDLSINETLEFPFKYELKQNFPNPFNPTTTIAFSVPEFTDINLTIYNIKGQEVYRKPFYSLLPGNYEHLWNAEKFNSGIYIYTVNNTTGLYLKEKMILIK